MSGALNFLYGTAPGRLLLRPLVSRPISRFAGRLLDTRASRALIPLFVRRTGIDTGDYDLSGVRCFNDFFCRPIRPGLRRPDMAPEALIAPCDGLLTAAEIREDTVLPVKQSRFTLERLLMDPELAERFRGGVCLTYRLCVEHYHRYCWFDGGSKGRDRDIPGVLHTVRPVALARRPVFAENSRSYALLESNSFGAAVQMEVGAMLVGRIVNRSPGPRAVRRGEEKGNFAYGGSTVLVLLGKDAAQLRPDILAASREGRETPVRMGERVGVSKLIPERNAEGRNGPDKTGERQG